MLKLRLYRITKKVKRQISEITWFMFNRNAPKVFCIGLNKTGTTSLQFVLKEFGFKMGNQAKGELLLIDYKNKNWDSIIKYCNTAEAFQDAPFSYPDTWRVLYKHFPKSKFILTHRDEEAWYRSITKFHSKHFSNGIDVPSKDDLLKANYRFPGFMYESMKAIFNTADDNLYQKEQLIAVYNKHNSDVIDILEGLPNFLQIDVSDGDSYLTLCKFLKKKPLYNHFPHLKKT